MNKKRNILRIVGALVMVMVMSLSIMPVTAMATVDPEAVSVETTTPEPVAEPVAEPEPIPDPAPAPEPAPEPVVPPTEPVDATVSSTGNPDSTPPPTYTVEYKVDGGSVDKQEGLAANAAFPAPPSAYAEYTWSFDDGSGNAFVWGDPAWPATIGERSWELNGTAPAPAASDASSSAPMIARASRTAGVQGGQQVGDPAPVSYAVSFGYNGAPLVGDAVLSAAELTDGTLAGLMSAAQAALTLQDGETFEGWILNGDAALITAADQVSAPAQSGPLAFEAQVAPPPAPEAKTAITVNFFDAEGDLLYSVAGEATESAPYAIAYDAKWPTDVTEWTLSSVEPADYPAAATFASGSTLAFSASHESVILNLAPVVDTDDEGKAVVTFWSNGGEIDKQKVEIGSTVNAPAAPELPAGMLSFRGWYLNDTGSGDPFDFTTKITANVDLYAVFSDQYLVLFKDAEGDVFESQEVGAGGNATLPGETPVPLDDTQMFQYWYIEGAEGADKVPFDFVNTPINSNLTLVPEFGSYFYVFFNANGGTLAGEGYTMAEAGATIVEPAEPTRAGYEFAYWSRIQDADWTVTDDAYSFGNESVDNTFTLYAIWTPTVVSYKVVYWNEKPNMPLTFDKNNPDNYQFSYIDTTLTAMAGETVSVAAGDALPAGMTDTTRFYSEFYKSDEVEVKGDDTTVVNVYLTRRVFTFTFNADASTAGSTSNPTNTPSGAGGIIHTNLGTQGPSHTIQVKFEMDVSNLWPTSVTYPDKPTRHFLNWSGYYNNSGMICSQSYLTVAFSNPALTAETIFILSPFNYTVQDVARTSITIVPKIQDGGTVYTEQRFYWTEVREGETTTNQTRVWTDGKTYQLVQTAEVNTQSSSPAKNAPGWPGRDIIGYETIMAAGKGTFDTTKYQEIVQSKDDPLHYSLNYFMPIKTSSLTLVTTGNGSYGTFENPAGYTYAGSNGSYSASAPYGTPLKDMLPAELTKAGTALDDYSFGGWYIDSGFQTKFNAEAPTATMPQGGMTLYAKWTQGQSTVTFYDKVGGTQVDEKDVDIGFSVNPSTKYTAGSFYEGLGVFQGWGRQLAGTSTLQPYNFNAPITGPLSLYGIWRTSGFTVKYEAGAGTGTPPVDSNTYKLDVLAPVASGEGLTSNTSGLIFLGWQIKGTGVVYYPGSSVKVNGDIVFVAFYADRDSLVNINYHSNYAGGAATVSVPAVRNTESVPLGEGTFSREGYTLMGWSNASADGNSIDYPFGVGFTVADNMDLYAVWAKNPTYTVTFKVNDEAGGYLQLADGTQAPIFEHKNVKRGTAFSTFEWPKAIAKDGYYFTGWNRTFNGQYVTSDLEFIANFVKITDIRLNVDVKANNQSKLYSQVDPALTYTLAPELKPYASHFDISVTRVAGEDVGTYAIELSFAVKEKFKDRYNVIDGNPNATLTINKLGVTLTPTDAGKVYGDKDPSPLTKVGMQYQDVPNSIPGFAKAALDYTVSRRVGENVGQYPITIAASDAANPNYDIDTKAAVFTISKEGSPLVINMGNFQKVYGNADPTDQEVADTLTVSNLRGGDTADMLGLEVTRAPGEDVGTYNYTITYDEDFAAANYSGVTVNAGTLAISKRLVVLYANNLPAPGQVLYPTSTLPAYTAFIDPNTPLAFGQTELAYSLYLTNYAGTGTPPAGSYTIGFNADPNAELNRNYNIKVYNGTLTITAPGGGGTTDGGTTDGGGGTTPATPVIPAVVPPAPTPADLTPAGPAPDDAGAPTPVATQPDEAEPDAQLVNLDGNEVPLVAPAVGQWALLNLLVAVLALAFAVLLFATMFKRNKKRDETEEEQAVRMAAEASAGEEPEEDVRNRRSGMLWRSLSILAGVLAPIVFLLTENMNNPMIFTDRWTLLMVVILAIQVICMALLRYVRGKEDHPEEQAYNV